MNNGHGAGIEIQGENRAIPHKGKPGLGEVYKFEKAGIRMRFGATFIMVMDASVFGPSLSVLL